MNQTQINAAISNAFINLSSLNHDLYDYWINVLYLVDGDFNVSMWNEHTLNQMENDVYYNSLCVC